MAGQGEIDLIKIFPSLPRTIRGLPIVLSVKPDDSTYLYCNGHSVYLRDVEDITKTDVYTEHAVLTTVAKYAPSGFYIASGDQSGKVRIWDTTQQEHILKNEYPVILGPIRDIAWDSESKRIAAVGEAREKFGHVFLFDTGTSAGNLTGQSRPVSSVDFKPTRPFRVVSGSEDNTVAIFEGPPFKFKTFFHEHERFVHCVRYNKAGTMFASAGADGKVIVFDGTDGQKLFELLDPAVKAQAAHEGGIFSLCWSPDDTKLATASGDRKVKIFDVTERQHLKTIDFGKELNNQQLGLIWTKKWILSVSLAGYVSYVDPEEGEIKRILKGHNKPITAACLSQDKKFFFTADFEGNITRWDVATGESDRLDQYPHKTQISGMAVTPEGKLITIAWDDVLGSIDGILGDLKNSKAEAHKLNSQPRGLAVTKDGQTRIVAGHKHITVLKEKGIVNLMEIDFEGLSAAIHPDNKVVAIGSADGKIRIYDLSSDGKLTETKTMTHTGIITSLEFSLDGKHLVASDASRKVVVYKTQDYTSATEKEWTFHTARVNTASFSPNGRYIASGGLDTHLMVWDLQNSGEHPKVVRNAHKMNCINVVRWLDDETVLSVGQDSNIKQWKVRNL
ncbi:unnamed protein product [Bursaphelenchus okinawaensis]|uniref:Actin-interacting protein 1 n=1 Tax=Bursaphelenchus okinawaensis TaxID=465554 RepID=A0A811KQ72_9BILA|nr:unnamed protein product [Bursaphelenchus okinawaensis]CAG9107323.1 unnamed protein product [Bursaphelenchus okinawaensis]